MSRMFIIGLVALLIGCAAEKPKPTPTTVVIVEVVHSEETGSWDWMTIVEFPDGERRCRWFKWGEVGDEFKAVKHGIDGWR